MTGRLVLLTHAETAATRTAAFPRDESVTPRGQAALADIAKALPHPARIWRSPAVAAADTARAFAGEAEIAAELDDLDCGRWRGQPIREVAEHEPDALAAWIADPAFQDHGGQSIDALLARVGIWLVERLQDHGTSLAISHAAVLRCAILATLGASARRFWAIDAAPLTALTLSSDGRRWTLRGLQSLAPPTLAD